MEKKLLKIFLVDDDLFSLNMYQQHLLNLGYDDVVTFANGTDCLHALTQQPDIIFLDHTMDVLNGLEILKKIKRFNPDIYVVFLSGQENLETAVESLKFGAFDYIPKGEYDTKRIGKVIDRILEVKQLLQKNKRSFFNILLSIF